MKEYFYDVETLNELFHINGLYDYLKLFRKTSEYVGSVQTVVQ